MKRLNGQRGRIQLLSSAWWAEQLIPKKEMADGLFYNDIRQPFITADVPAVTLATTMKALYPVSNFPALGTNYFTQNKKMRIRAFGRITTALTPGNGQFGVFWGTGADNTGVSLGTSQAFALTASQTNLSWELDIFVHCRTGGSAGGLFLTGHAFFNEAVAAPHQLIPASAAAVSASVDLTSASSIVSVQFLRSGSTVETMQVHDMEVYALN